MDQLNNRVLDYKGYQVVVYDNGDIIMYRHGRFVMQALCSKGMSDEEVRQVALTHSVFGRVTPEQKCIIVKALKEAGKKVAMTGDGVNDILALKEADCSIAMASGSDATRSASNLVMLDSNFSSMPKVVGR